MSQSRGLSQLGFLLWFLHHDQNHLRLERVYFIRACSPVSGDFRAGTADSNQETGTDAGAMEGCGLLSSSVFFGTQDHQPSLQHCSDTYSKQPPPLTSASTMHLPHTCIFSNEAPSSQMTQLVSSRRRTNLCGLFLHVCSCCNGEPRYNNIYYTFQSIHTFLKSTLTNFKQNQ